MEGATLERTAEEAGLARALIRHNVGNKNELLEAFLDKFLGEASEETGELFGSLPRKNRVSTMVKWLFDPRNPDEEEISVTNALIVAASERPALAARLQRWTNEFIGMVQLELQGAYPDADADRTAAVATGIAAIFFNVDTLASLGDIDQLRRDSEAAANLLVSTLED